MKKITALALFLYIVPRTMAQHMFTISGDITNNRQELIAGGSIKIRTAEGGLIKYFAISDSKGAFIIKIPNRYPKLFAECSFIGYKSSYFFLQPDTGQTQSIIRNMILENDTSVLREVNVRAISPIKVSGDTTSFRTEAFKQGNESTVGDLLSNLPGFSVEDGRIKYNGKEVSRVLIENDDLFGRDYATVTQNLNPRGIEQVDLIKNYNDKTYLSNALTKGNEQVVNLKFNKKYLSRISTTNEVAANEDLSFYQIHQNIISLLPKIKFITTTNFNNTGLLGSDILGKHDKMILGNGQNDDAVNFDLPAKFSPVMLAQLGSITSAIVPANRMVFNNTKLVTDNLLYKPSKKLLVKNVFQYYNDKYSEYQHTTTNYSISGNPLIVTDQESVLKKLSSVNISSECIYNVSPAVQLIYKINFNYRKHTDSSGDILQTLPTYHNLYSNTHHWQQQLGMVLLLGEKKLLEIKAVHVQNANDENMNGYPAILWKTITLDSTHTNIGSVIHDIYNETNISAKLTAKLKKWNYAIEGVFTKGNTGLNTDGNLFNMNSAASTATLIGFSNTLTWDYSIASIAVQVSKQLSPKFSISTSQKTEAGNISYLDNITGSKTNRNYFNYLPTLGIEYKLSARSNLGISWSVANKLPSVYDILPAYTIVSENEVTKGANSMVTGISHNISATYFYAEPLKRHLTFFLVASIMEEPLLYLTDNLPGAFYTVSNKLAVSRNFGGLIIYSGITKYVRIIKSQLSLNIATFTSNSYYSANHVILPMVMSYSKPEFKSKTLVTKELTMSLGAKANFLTQKTSRPGDIVTKTSSALFDLNMEAVYRLSKSFVFNARYQYIISSQEGQDHYLGLFDASMSYHVIKEKLTLNLRVNNLMDKRQFISASFMPISEATQIINLMPRFFLLQATVQL